MRKRPRVRSLHHDRRHQREHSVGRRQHHEVDHLEDHLIESIKELLHRQCLLFFQENEPDAEEDREEDDLQHVPIVRRRREDVPGDQVD